MSKIPISLDEDFERELQNLKRNHDYTYMKITGLQPKQLDFAQYINLFCEANNQADFSVDGTSNSDSKDIVALENDINKPIFKMVAFNKIYVKLRDKYGEDAANNWLKSEYLDFSYLLLNNLQYQFYHLLEAYTHYVQHERPLPKNNTSTR